MVRVVGIRGVRMLMEHLIATLPERKVRTSLAVPPVIVVTRCKHLLKHTIESAYIYGRMQQLVLEAMATVVCLNEDYRPTRMFPEMANLLHFFSHPN